MIPRPTLLSQSSENVSANAELPELLSRRVLPTFYVINSEFEVQLACGAPPGPSVDRMPAPIERIVRNLVEAARRSADGAIGLEKDTIVRVLQPYCSSSELMCVIAEQLRLRDPLRDAVRRHRITARETDVLRLLLRGASTTAIAKRLHIAETTAGEHVKRIAAKTGARNRSQIVSRVLGFF